MNWLENMVLRSKLILLTAFMMVGLLTVSGISLNSVSNWQSQINEMGKNTVPSILGIMKMRVGYNNLIVQQNRARGLIMDPKRIEKWTDSSKKMDEAWENYKEGYELYMPTVKNVEEKAEWKKYEENMGQWKELSDKFQNDILKPLASGTLQLDDAAIFEQMTKFIDESRDSMKNMRKNMNAISDINEAASVALVKVAQEKSSAASTMTLVVSSASLILAFILSMLIIRSVTRAISASVSSIRDGAMQITSASQQVASSSSSLAQGASQQASSVEEVSATLEQSTAINTQNVDNARQADILAKNASDSAQAGYEKGKELSRSMRAITESAAKISGIIKAIDQIAFQTNLLALNAAVEAARAGEHGLGFAVVADEVRNLAQRAAAAAKETSVIIEEVVGQIKEGNEIALATNTSFHEIVEQSKKVSNLIGEISIAGKEQSEGMTQINQAMGQVDQVTQQVAASSEEAAAAAEELSAQATSMLETIGILAKIVGMESETHAISAPKKNQIQHLVVNKAPMQLRKNIPTPQSKGRSVNKAEDIFPLNEDDLREF